MRSFILCANAAAQLLEVSFHFFFLSLGPPHPTAPLRLFLSSARRTRLRFRSIHRAEKLRRRQYSARMCAFLAYDEYLKSPRRGARATACHVVGLKRSEARRTVIEARVTDVRFDPSGRNISGMTRSDECSANGRKNKAPRSIPIFTRKRILIYDKSRDAID